jgi:cell division protein FtsN
VRYRHAWPGLLLLGALGLLLVSLLVWGDHFLTPGPAGGIRRLLEIWPASGSQSSAAHVTATLTEPGDGAAPASDLADEPPPQEAPRAQDAPPAAAAITPGRPVRPAVSLVRYALDLGTFAIDEDAERAEAQLNQAGFSTVRFRLQPPARLYAVAVLQAGEAGPVETSAGSIRVAQDLPLRSAVKLAERLRAAGYRVRILAAAAKAAQITLRHGNFASRDEAESVRRELSRLGVLTEVVQVR